MRVLIAFDKFKDALTARQACEVTADALRAKHPQWEIDLCPLTDGGEGFCEILTRAAGGTLEPVEVSGPRGGAFPAQLGRIAAAQLPAPARERLGLAGTEFLAVADMASASGLALLAPGERNPWQASSVGTGQLLAAAAGKNPAAILLGVGGSATNDLGLGALSALGLGFFDAFSHAVASPGAGTLGANCAGRGPHQLAATLHRLRRDQSPARPARRDRHLRTAKGPARRWTCRSSRRRPRGWRRCYAIACERPRELTATPGAGAAGGLAFGLMVACGAQLVPGFDLVSDWLDLPARLAAADLVITGEGRFDATSLGGKGPGSLVAESRRRGKPAHVFAGSLGLPADGYLHAITPADLPLAEALPRTAELLAAAVTRVL